MIKLKEKILNVKAEKLFLYFAVIFGLSFIIVTPPFQVADENYHFYQAYTISELYTNSENGTEKIPGFYIRIDSTFSKLPFEPENKISVEYLMSLFKYKQDPNDARVPFVCPASHYSFMLYVPQVIGIWTGRIFSAPPIVLLYLGRLFAMIFWIILVYYSIKITPLPKWMFFLIVLTPISLFQGVSFSADSVLNSVSFVLIAIILRYAFDESKTELNLKTILIIIFLSLIITVSKPPYLILVFAYFFIPYKKLKTRNRYFLCFVLILAVNLLFISAWNYFIKTPINSDLTNKTEQISFILNNPFGYLRVFFNTLILRSLSLSQQIVGKLGWLDAKLPEPIVVLYLIVMVFTAVYEKSEKIVNIDKGKKFLIFSILAANVLLVFTLFFLITKKGSTQIDGIQSRYFIPFYPLLFLIFYNRKFILKKEYVRIIAISVSFITLLSAVISLIIRYYYL